MGNITKEGTKLCFRHKKKWPLSLSGLNPQVLPSIFLQGLSQGPYPTGQALFKILTLPFFPLPLTFNMSRFSVFMKWRTFTKFKHLCMKGFYCLVYQLYPHLSEPDLHCSINTELVIQSYHSLILILLTCMPIPSDSIHSQPIHFWERIWRSSSSLNGKCVLRHHPNPHELQKTSQLSFSSNDPAALEIKFNFSRLFSISMLQQPLLVVQFLIFCSSLYYK